MKKIFSVLVLSAFALFLYSCGSESFTLQDEIRIVAGEERELKPTFQGDAIEVEYSSSDENIVTYVNGVLKGISPGTATITVKQKKGNAQASAKIVVNPFTVTYITYGGVFGEEDEMIYNYSPADFPVYLPEPEKYGYNFSAWYTDYDFPALGKKTALVDGTSGNLVLHAKYTPKDYKYLFYESDGVTAGKPMAMDTGATSTTVAGNKVEFNFDELPIELKAPKDKSADNAFAGWFTTPEADFSNHITHITKENVETIKTLYAVFGSAADITWELNGGGWQYLTYTDVMEDFLTDVHAFMKHPDPLMVFIHGKDTDGKALSSGFLGTWQIGSDGVAKNVLAALYIDAYRVGSDTTKFFYNTAMRAKWLGFGDVLETYVVAVNSTQHFWAPGSVAYTRLRGYAINQFKTASQKIDSQNYIPVRDILNPRYVQYIGVPRLQTPYKAGATFDGWYTTANFAAGTKIETIPVTQLGTITLYAKWK